jgi:hypothetical protein
MKRYKMQTFLLVSVCSCTTDFNLARFLLETLETFFKTFIFSTLRFEKCFFGVSDFRNVKYKKKHFVFEIVDFF